MSSSYIRPIPCALNPISFHVLGNYTLSTTLYLSNTYNQFLWLDTSHQIFKRLKYFPFRTKSALSSFVSLQLHHFQANISKESPHTLHSFPYHSLLSPFHFEAAVSGLPATSMLQNPRDILLSSSSLLSSFWHFGSLPPNVLKLFHWQKLPIQ